MEPVAWIYLGNNSNILIPVNTKIKDLPFFIFGSLSDLRKGIKIHKQKYPELYKWQKTSINIEEHVSKYNRLFIHDNTGQPVDIRIELIPIHIFGQVLEDV